jgi:hypothetical protein
MIQTTFANRKHEQQTTTEQLSAQDDFQLQFIHSSLNSISFPILIPDIDEI